MNDAPTPPAEPGYDEGSENLATAGYIFALIFPIVGLALGLVLLGRNRAKAGWTIVAISMVVLIATGIVLALALGGDSSSTTEPGVLDDFGQ